MKKMILISFLSLTMIVPSMGQSAQKKMKTTIQAEINYLMFLPKDYSEKGEPSPMIVFLHGSGERGNDLEKVKAWGPPAIVEKNPDFPFIVLSPQCPEGQWWNSYLIKGMIDDVLATYNVDKNRVYLTGLSMGGFGTWDLAIAYPNYFAAIAPICGGGNPQLIYQLKDIPIWVFHGKKDTSVPEERSAEMVEALKKIGANVEYTVLPEGGHADAWIYAYNKAGLFDWFLKHEKK
ncbi:MAG TPA: prolyl oligopeptidase family serine peptidase [Prolixibacteraceae bacterium]|nr:prolyl oligopeptidase family serine peptidase [Prolixibacteraceae bacterium]